ncbi:hypothetical protein [Plebeiibacterium sediminum]|uniref:Uncharacterized protein n=1 Tax=Plebeiibacterium sediminum TaxID=2992112 RepID=A0AAE3SFQ6_9BACT|nr:hypothetical protein [Plebeiobacterium sediminum]MCW3786438.1 hypothetical protein [Plebeiobacterium sediminum]
MKKIIYILSHLILILLVLTYESCINKSNRSNQSDRKTEMITSDFKADFTGTYLYTGPDTLPAPHCTDTILPIRVKVKCTGTSDLMGEINVHFDFCVNPNNGHYGNVYSYFVDSDSDTLFVGLEGAVINGKTDDHPSYVTSYWKDDFVILGGTGKFEDATGNGKTDDYNSSEDQNSHHHWEGQIMMKNKD